MTRTSNLPLTPFTLHTSQGAILVNPLRSTKPVVFRSEPAPLLLSDFYLQQADTLIKEYLNGTLNPPGFSGVEPVPPTAVINEFGQGSCRGSKCTYAVIKAELGTCEHPAIKVRFRIVCMHAWLGRQCSAMCPQGCPGGK